MFLPRDKLLGATCALLQIEGREEAALIEEALDGLIARRAVVSDMVGRVEAIYLCRLWEAEVTVAERLRTLLSFPADQGRRVEALIDRIEAEQGVTYAAGQRRAVALSAAEARDVSLPLPPPLPLPLTPTLYFLSFWLRKHGHRKHH